MPIHQNDLYDLESEKFFQIPKFFEEEPFNELSLTARYIYGLLLDQFKLSEKETFTDSEGYIVSKFSVAELMKKTGLSNKPVIKAKKDLEDFGFIRQKRVFNGSNYIYVMKPSEIVESVQSTPPKVENVHNESVQSTPPKVENVHSNYTKQTRLNKTRLNNQEELEEISYLDIEQTPPPPPKKSMDFGQFIKRSGLKFNPIVHQTLMGYIAEDGMSLELVKLAITKAAKDGIDSPSYVYRILDNWKAKGITTLEQGLKEQEEFEASKTKNKTSHIDEDEAKRMQEKYGF